MTGRGTGDMKGGVSAMVFALDALASLGLEPASRVHIKTVSEEECTGNGALATLARGYRADAALIPESMGHRILRAELGSVWFRLRILGRPDHVLAARGPGAHAILAAQDYMAALQGLADAMNIEAQKHRWFSQIPEPVKFNPGKIRGRLARLCPLLVRGGLQALGAAWSRPAGCPGAGRGDGCGVCRASGHTAARAQLDWLSGRRACVPARLGG
ncbi:M20/M25/M40 family metallo-hydrolase [Gemmobacter lanyuensis]